MHDVARLLPEAQRIVACVDSLSGFADPAKESFTVIDAADLGLPRFHQLAFALNATGLCCAIKPFLALHAFARVGARHVLYLDNDIRLLRHPEEMLALLKTNDLVLTPHLLAPLPTGAVPDERTILGYGTFNAGMFAVRATESAQVFLRWWGSRTAEPMHMKQATGYDQVWLNLASTIASQTAIVRDVGYNVASWNLASRPLTLDGAEFRAGEAPLTTFHFSGFDETRPHQLVAPDIQCNVAPSRAWEKLAHDFTASLIANGAAECRRWSYGFARFSDGRPITLLQRQYFAEKLWSETPADADPFNPAFTTVRSTGTRSLYRYHEISARASRYLRRMFAR